MGGRAEAGPCPECGVENAADHNYCKNCGTPLGLDEGGELKLSFAERMRDRCLAMLKSYAENPPPHFERCLQLEDAYPAAHFQLALCHYRRGAMAECVTASRRAIELNPSSAPAHFRLAIALFHQGQLGEPARAFEGTVAAAPGAVG